MIASITLCIHHSSKIRKLGIDRPTVRFAPGYNVLIGANGTGKSTLLRAVATCPMCEVERTGGAEDIKYITTEMLNPLVGGRFSNREEMVQGIRAMFRSHGQGVRDSLVSQEHARESAILIDSPETGQDHDNCEHIYEGLRKMAERYQVIAATNSLVFMRNANVIDLGQDTLSRLVEATAGLVEELGRAGERARSEDG